MSPNGTIVDSGNYPNWYGLISPFSDRPDVTAGVIFYSVPYTNDSCHPTTFNAGFWDWREHFVRLSPGTIVSSLVPYFGHIGSHPNGPIIGSEYDFLNGLEYQPWVEGNYNFPSNCCPFELDQETTMCSKADATYEVFEGFTSEICNCEMAEVTYTSATEYTSSSCICQSVSYTSTENGNYNSTICECISAYDTYTEEIIETSMVCECMSATNS